MSTLSILAQHLHPPRPLNDYELSSLLKQMIGDGVDAAIPTVVACQARLVTMGVSPFETYPVGNGVTVAPLPAHHSLKGVVIQKGGATDLLIVTMGNHCPAEEMPSMLRMRQIIDPDFTQAQLLAELESAKDLPRELTWLQPVDSESEWNRAVQVIGTSRMLNSFVTARRGWELKGEWEGGHVNYAPQMWWGFEMFPALATAADRLGLGTAYQSDAKAVSLRHRRSIYKEDAGLKGYAAAEGLATAALREDMGQPGPACLRTFHELEALRVSAAAPSLFDGCLAILEMVDRGGAAEGYYNDGRTQHWVLNHPEGRAVAFRTQNGTYSVLTTTGAVELRRASADLRRDGNHPQLSQESPPWIRIDRLDNGWSISPATPISIAPRDVRAWGDLVSCVESVRHLMKEDLSTSPVMG